MRWKSRCRTKTVRRLKWASEESEGFFFFSFFVFLCSGLSFVPEPPRGISLHSSLPFDHTDPGEANSAGAVVRASPPHLLPLPPLSVSLFVVGIATGVRLVRDGTVVSLSSFFFFPLSVSPSSRSSDSAFASSWCCQPVLQQVEYVLVIWIKTAGKAVF